ncbi:MAG: carboxypeptidase M32 [Defluviitaleaceae bacterium]|nr:carboxypeptidase M32 [Defluviitaleaceae bacterium]
MNLQQAQNKFKELNEKLRSYAYVGSIASFDMSTQAPAKGKAAAAKNLSLISAEAFSIRTGEEMKNTLEVLCENKDKLDEVTAKEVELLSEELEKSRKIPKELFREYREHISISGNVWQEAKEKSDFAMFAPYLEKTIDYKKQLAAITKPEMTILDAWLDDFEPETKTEELDAFFSVVREKTVPLLAKIQKEGKPVREDFVSRHYPKEIQRQVAHKLLEMFKFDLNAGLLAESAHPFATTITHGDVRLTTKFHEDNILAAIGSTIHEGGHGIYNQNAQLSPIVGNTGLAFGTSSAIHESQSRFCENMIGMSETFWQYFYPTLQEYFKEQLSDVSADEFHRALNVTKPSFIRIEADELTYNLHIMVRFEVEKLLAEGNVPINELPKIWNDKYTEYLGVTPPNDKLGILQDIHFSAGLFGYFPTYSLGNAYAAQMLHVMKKTVDIDATIKSRDLAPIVSWLNENVHKYGRLKKAKELIMDISGEPLNPKYLTDYLEQKFTKLYFL